MNELPRDPRKEIMELGSRISVEVQNAGQTRCVSVNVFDPSAPPFSGNTPESAVCNSIKKEIIASRPLPTTPSIAAPSKTPELSKGIDTPAQDRGSISR